MKIAVMQPYFFPYIGYFQLINVVDKFIFYDDVNYIKNGWINRNRVLINGNPSYLTVQLKGASPFKLINEIECSNEHSKLLKTIQIAYKKAPYFNQAFPVFENCLSQKTDNLSELAISSVKLVCSYLELQKDFEISSISYANSKGYEKAERLIEICKSNNASTYINAIGGQSLYSKEYFEKEGINLEFIKCSDIIYSQFNSHFIPCLSIIDVMMFNSKDDIKNMLNEYIML